MKAFIILSDAARTHPDGTFSLLRGGIDRVTMPRGRPLEFRGSFFAQISGTLGEGGEHEFCLQVLDQDGHPVAPEVRDKFVAPREGGAGNIAVDFSLFLPGYGQYVFVLTVDRQRLADATFTAQPPDSAEKLGGRR